jgi:hypothetical protein
MIYNAADNTDIMVLNLFHAGFPVRRNASGNIAVKITGWWKDIPQDIAECQHDRELIRDGLMLTAAGDRYLYMLGVVEGVYKAQERPKTAFEVAGGNL